VCAGVDQGEQHVLVNDADLAALGLDNLGLLATTENATHREVVHERTVEHTL
jgi:hypothetical protein